MNYFILELLGNLHKKIKYVHIVGTFSINSKAGHDFLSAIKEYEDNVFKIGGYTYRKAVQYMNASGGITLIDYLEEEIKEVVSNKIEKILRNPDNLDNTAKLIHCLVHLF